MIRIHASVTKKVPIPGVDYSSRSYLAGLEVEAGDNSAPEEIRQRLTDIYNLLEESIDREIQADTALVQVTEHVSPQLTSTQENTSRSARPATKAQIKAIFAIAKSAGLHRNDLSSLIHERYNADGPDQISVKQASELIELLQSSHREAVA